MPLAPPQGHVVGTGGLNPVSPSTIGYIPYISSLVPPQSKDSVARMDAGKFYVGEVALNHATIFGGAVGNANAGRSVIIGEGATFSPTSAVPATETSVVIGNGALGGTGFTARNVVIGDGASAVGGGDVSEAVVIGRAAKLISPAGGASTVLIGASASISLGSQLVIIGSNAAYTGNNVGVVIGYNSAVSGGAGVASNLIVGCNNASSKTRNILLGHTLVDGNSAAGDNVIIGQSYTTPASGALGNAIKFVNSNPYTTLLIGSGETSSVPTSLTFRLTNGVGSDIGGGNLILSAGLGTGAGDPGRFVFNVGAKSTTGAVAHVPYEALAIASNVANSIVTVGSPTGRDAIIAIGVAAVNKAYIGVAGATNGIATGSAVSELVIRTETQRIVISTDGGASIASTFTTGGIQTWEKDRGLRFMNQTTGAGASAGTLGNSPTAGNPGFWLKINIGGTSYAIPCWLG